MKKDDCLFCRIGQHQEEAKFIYEDQKIFIIENKFPKAKVHLLVIPKDHCEFMTMDESDKDTLVDLVLATKKGAEASGILESGFRTIINTGDDSGRHFEHLHLHVLGGEELGEF